MSEDLSEIDEAAVDLAPAAEEGFDAAKLATCLHEFFNMACYDKIGVPVMGIWQIVLESVQYAEA